jgi:hypothetical protein
VLMPSTPQQAQPQRAPTPVAQPSMTITPPAPVVVTAPVTRQAPTQSHAGVGVEMVERTVRFTVPSTEAILPANLFKAGLVASLAAGLATATSTSSVAAIAAPDGRDDQMALDFASVATSPLMPAVDIATVANRVIDITAEDVTTDDLNNDEFGEIDLGSDPSTDDVIATARRFARVPLE